MNLVVTDFESRNLNGVADFFFQEGVRKVWGRERFLGVGALRWVGVSCTAYKRSKEKICVFSKILLQLHFKLGFDPCMGPIGAEYFRDRLEGFVLPGALAPRPSWLCPHFGGRSGASGLACGLLTLLR